MSVLLILASIALFVLDLVGVVALPLWVILLPLAPLVLGFIFTIVAFVVTAIFASRS